MSTFAELGLSSDLCEICTKIKWDTPTQIQQESIPPALRGKDIVGLAQTGSGKTGAFALPILHNLIRSVHSYPAAVIVAPTRELAYQIDEVLQKLGKVAGLKTVVVVGGMDMNSQVVGLNRNPHIIVGTPGRLVDHLRSTKGFSISRVRYLVLDEADELLKPDFKESIDIIVQNCPSNRQTFLFSATMTNNVQKLLRVCTKDPVRVSVSDKYQAVETLNQKMLLIPADQKLLTFVTLIVQLEGQTMIVFTRTTVNTQRVSKVLSILGFSAEALYGTMDQPRRLEALNKFKRGDKKILVATDVASRGLDIPSVDCVINYDLPKTTKTYMHRVGRTARAGRYGLSFTFVTQYDAIDFTKIETSLASERTKEGDEPWKMEMHTITPEMMAPIKEKVTQAERLAIQELKEGTSRAHSLSLTASLLNEEEDPLSFSSMNDSYRQPDDEEIVPRKRSRSTKDPKSGHKKQKKNFRKH
ncbi:putative ATP-dependent rRNA helicase RRP3 [Blattamonas nauphoetae]|uniref:ATP-dependent rRNA helicase RRP3 n=1 Tax=Blattamonas nauphoetae TaxID=2049346 RepID=A0ABQ9XZZ6_9EUKA|nr:putative ATP-dependent rRNA helicase RRP3 [Blattamonas nauphoetae]